VRILLAYSYSLDIDGLEYYFLRLVQQLAQGRTLYENPELYPYSNCLYTPIYFYLYHALIYLSGLDAYNSPHEVLIAGRMLSLTLVMVQLVYLVKLGNRLSNSIFQTMLLVTFYLLLITGHMYAVRPDSLKVLFFLVFLFSLVECLFFSGKKKDAIICVCAAIMAVYTKQDIVLHILVCLMAALLFLRNKKIVVLLAGFATGSVGLCFIALKIYGSNFITNVILFNIQQTTDLWRSYNIYFFILSFARTLPLLLVSLANYRKVKHCPATAEKFVVIITLLLYPVVHLSFFRAGANLNYTYELAALLALNIAVFFRLYMVQIRKKENAAVLVICCYLTFLLLSNAGIKNYYFSVSREADCQKEYFDILKESKSIKAIVGNDTMFFPNTKYSIFYVDKNVVLGHDMHLDRFTNLYTSVYLKSKLAYIDTKAYDRNFTDGTVKYIVISYDPKSMRHVREYYPFYSTFKNTKHFLVYQFTPH
jgi:hypothetical protein